MSDLAEYAPAANTALLIVLAFLQRRWNFRTGMTVAAAADNAEAAAREAAYTGRVVKESHNSLVDQLAKHTYEDKPDPDTHKFPPRKPERRATDPPPPPER